MKRILPRRFAPHNDVLSENFIYDAENDNLQLIDWEYCGMNIYSFDVAAIIIENRLNKEKEEEFLRYYYGGELTERQRADVLCRKILGRRFVVPLPGSNVIKTGRRRILLELWS